MARKATTKTTKKKTTKEAVVTTPKRAKNMSFVERIKASRIPLSRTQIILIVAVLALLALLYFFKGLFVAAIVNGQPISRFALIQELEKQSGKQMLDTLVQKQLILQEAEEKNVMVTQDENKEIEEINKNVSQYGQNLDDLLAMQGMTRAQLEENIKIQALIEKLVTKDIQVTDKEADTYLQENPDITPVEGQDEAEVRTQVKEQLKEQKDAAAVDEWLKKLKDDAQIQYFVTY